jgi:hypothetical protein
VASLSIETLNAVVLFYALAANSLGSRGEGLRATWGWSGWPFPRAPQSKLHVLNRVLNTAPIDWL